MQKQYADGGALNGFLPEIRQGVRNHFRQTRLAQQLHRRQFRCIRPLRSGRPIHHHHDTHWRERAEWSVRRAGTRDTTTLRPHKDVRPFQDFDVVEFYRGAADCQPWTIFPRAHNGNMLRHQSSWSRRCFFDGRRWFLGLTVLGGASSAGRPLQFSGRWRAAI